MVKLGSCIGIAKHPYSTVTHSNVTSHGSFFKKGLPTVRIANVFVWNAGRPDK